MLSKEQIDELEKLAKQAVGGPWELEEPGFERESYVYLSGQGHSAFAELVWEMEDGDSDKVQATANYVSKVDPSTLIGLITILREVEHSRNVLHDSYVRHLEEIEDLKRQRNDLLGTLETLVKESINDAEGCPNSVTLADSVELIKRLKEK